MAKKTSTTTTEAAEKVFAKETAPAIGPDFFEKLGSKGIYLCLGIILLVTFFVFRDFILGKKIFLYKDIGSDTLNGVLPSFWYNADYLHKNGIPKWSFSEGMGASIFAGYTRDPFEMISFLIGPSSIPRIFIFIELIKLVLSGLVFYKFLNMLKISNFSSTIGALLYSFSGFMIIGACWYVFTFEALNIAMLLLAFELFYQKNKWMLFVFTIFLVCVSMPFNLYIFGLFLSTYVAFRLLVSPDFTGKKLIIMYAKLVALGVAGMLLAGPMLLENIIQLTESPRGSGGNSYFERLTAEPMFHLAEKEQFGAFIMRTFSSDMLGSGSNYTINGITVNGQFSGKNWGNFLEAPLSYCGILSLVLMSQVFGFMSKPARRWYIALFLLWLIPNIFPFFRYAFWLFQGDYYRDFSALIALVFIIYSVMALDLIIKHRKINYVILGSTVILLFILISYPYFKDYQKLVGARPLVDSTVSLFVKGLMVAYTALLLFLGRAKNPNTIKYVLMAVVCVELTYLSNLTVNRREVVMARELKEKTSVAYCDYTYEAVDYIKQNEKAPFYRIDKNYFSSGASNASLNDNKIQGFYTTCLYSSFAQINYINYLRSYDVISAANEYESRWAPGLINPPGRMIPINILEMLNNVKYILKKPGFPANPNWRFVYDSINKINDVTILKSKFVLPFGYTYNEYIAQSDFDKLNPTQKEFASLKAVVLKEDELSKTQGLKKWQITDTIAISQFNLESLGADIKNLRKDSLNMSLFSENKIEGKANVSENKVMYLSFPYDKGWHLKVDGTEVEKMFVSNGMTGIYLTKGEHTIDLEYKLRAAGKGVYLTIIGLLFCGGLFFFFKKFGQTENNAI